MPNIQLISYSKRHEQKQCYRCLKSLKEEMKFYSLGAKNRRYLCRQCRDGLYIDLPDDELCMSYNLVSNGKTLSIEEII